jgi:hypothetical protein
MLEPGGELDHALEPIGPEGGGKLGDQHLQRHGLVVLEIPGQLDRGHSPAPKLALNT